MNKLLISQVMSLHPNASTSPSAELPQHPVSLSSSSSRNCLMGCADAKPSDLRRFPVHDLNRCNHWLRYFRISDQLLTKLGGLHKLRICHRHFYNPQASAETARTTRKAIITTTPTTATTATTATARQNKNHSQNKRQSQSQSQVQVMARTRIKMTPLRKTKQQFNSNNGNGTAAAAATTTPAPAPSATAATTTTIINGIGTGKPLLDDATTIELVETPIEVNQQKHQMIKKNSVTTITLPSSVTVPPPPPPPLLPPQRAHSICSSASSDVQSINSDYEASSSENMENGRKRKLYVITEKFDEKTTTNRNSQDLTSNGQLKKRKMFVVVEQEKDGQSKKLMIMTDKQQNGGEPNNLSQKLEKLLPEILNRIQTKEHQQMQQQPPQQQQQHQQPQKEPAQSVITSSSIAQKSPITLPPKKNPTNFIKVQQSLNQAFNPASTPHSVSILPAGKEDQLASNDMETNINLSPDFRFLMKILPKLEQLPEPHKQDVKRSIQIFVEKSYSIYGKKD